MIGLEQKLRLYGFNNLTKTLSFNIYDVCYAKSEREQKDYIAYIDEQYNSERLTKILCDVTDIIGAHVLNIAKQDYEPQGASVTLLVGPSQMPSGELASSDLGILQHVTVLWGIWIKVTSPFIPTRNTIRIPLSLLFVLISMSPPVEKSLHSMHWII